MRIYMLFLVLFASSPLFAKDVYKWTNEEGVVIYSDTYRGGAERIRVPDGKSSFGAPSDTAGQPQSGGEGSATGEAGYTSLEIVQPENNATIRNNEGTVAVGLVITPALAEGHSLKIVVDGAELEGEMRGSQFSLNNLNRGTHSLVTRVVDADGNVLISSNSINFHLRKASILNP
jgi:hypothetical protein